MYIRRNKVRKNSILYSNVFYFLNKFTELFLQSTCFTPDTSIIRA